MENNLEFSLQEYIYNWSQNLKKQPSFTDSDVEELKSHFLDIVDDLKTKGLDEEEACYIASKRLGSSLEWEEDFKNENNSVIQLRKSVMLLSGIIAYFFFYYLILFTSKLFLAILLITNVEEFIAINWAGRYLVSVHFLLVISTISVFFLEDRAIKFLNRVEFTTKRTIYLLITTFFTGVLNTSIYPMIKNLISDINLKGHLIKYYIYFNYTFPVLVCICFLFLYLKFNKENRI